jgi:hypothetical protein
MDQIARIKELLGTADRADKKTSAERWEAARLIYEQLQAGQRQADLAREIGCHHNKVRWMARCWELVGSRYAAGSPLPDFGPIYLSKDVRGESGKDPGQPDGRTTRWQQQPGESELSGRREPRESDRPDNTAHGRVVAIRTAARSLADNRGMDIGLRASDWDELGEARSDIGRVLSRRPASDSKHDPSDRKPQPSNSAA